MEELDNEDASKIQGGMNMTSDQSRSTAFDVIVCGSLHLDIMVQASDIPRIDETVVGQTWKQILSLIHI